MVSPIEYKIFSTYHQTHLLGTATNVAGVIQKIDSVIYREDANYIIQQIDYELNEEYTFAILYGIDDFEKFKSMYENKQKRLIR